VGVAVSVGWGVNVAVAVAVLVGVAVSVGGTAVSVTVTALMASVANISTLAVAARVGIILSRKEADPLASAETVNPIKPVKAITITASKARFLMAISPEQ
jgi:hypothetical protein